MPFTSSAKWSGQWPGVAIAWISSSPERIDVAVGERLVDRHARVARQRAADDLDAEPLREPVRVDDVVAVLVRDEHVRDRDLALLDLVEQRLLDAVRVDEHAVPAVAVGDEVGVRRPLRVLGALEQHQKEITLRMPSCASISSKPRFTSSSVMRCEMNDSASMSPASQRSTSIGTPSRPLTPPNDEPATRRPVIR